tara:strand:- start:2136 stop:4967 length:2832 start_codon:yes stop_codon:yes gene_type:complete
MRKYLFILTTFALSQTVWAQYTISGTISDKTTGESLIGATLIYGDGQGAVADFDGNFQFTAPPEKIKIKASYVGYQSFETTFLVERNTFLKIQLGTITLSEVQVVADVAIDRKTPVAFSTIPMKKIEEELAAQDMPMILNSTPGVYATQQGGGDGDARITIRGFNQRNIAVMIDGIPVNDMENGWVYWSNWFGLSSVTSNIQVQRGLGASKIAIPSVGGTMNILTKGVSNKAGGSVKQEIGSDGFLKSSFGYNTGKSESGWGLTLAGSYKRGNGWVDQAFTEGYFYYTKLQKSIGKHLISLSAMGAPQKHGQRSYKSTIATYDNRFAADLNADTTGAFTNLGMRYNKHWGWLNRWSLNTNGDTIFEGKEALNTKQNFYHKPQFSLRDFWSVNDKFYISNIAYASIGHGGGTGITGAQKDPKDDNGQLSLQNIFDGNSNAQDTLYSAQKKSSTILKSAMNNHYWFGALSTFNYSIQKNLTLSGGIDLRTYKGEHYNEVHDLLGGDYYIDENNKRQTSMIKKVGDKIGYNYEGHVKWSGVFSQLEYSNRKLSGFFNLSGSNSAYQRIDHYKKKDLVLVDTTFTEALGASIATQYTYEQAGEIVETFNYQGADYIDVLKIMKEDTIWHNGQAYTQDSPEAKSAITKWKWIRGYTVKTGANYNIDDHNNVFFNTGYISKAPRFNNVFDRNNTEFRAIKNEHVKAVEGGYSYRSKNFSLNTNAYYTIWENKPSSNSVSIVVDDVSYSANINGMNALHKGIELDWAYHLKGLSLEWMMSKGDWTWTSADTVRYYDENNDPVLDDNGKEVIESFDAAGVHVGDAAQIQYAMSARWQISQNAWVKLKRAYFSNHYAAFSPHNLDGVNAGRESWMMPSYNLFDLHAGYKISLSKKSQLRFGFSILNLLNETYISDAQNNDPYNASTENFDANSAGVFFGMGRRYITSIKFTF